MNKKLDEIREFRRKVVLNNFWVFFFNINFFGF